MIQHALKYASELAWAVVPLHSIVNGICSCKESCKSPGKHPRTMQGVKDATTDVDKIKHWWGMWPDANIGVATGKISSIFVVDVDPRNGGNETLEAIEQANKKLPDDIYAITGGSGKHLVYQYPEQGIRSRKLPGGIDIKSDGGYIVVAPSNHISGKDYEWEASSDPFDGIVIPPAPDWWLSHLQNLDVPQSIESSDTLLSPEQIQEIRSALTIIPSDDRDLWIRMGMALHSTRAGNQAYGLWNEWSQQSDKYDPTDTSRVWNSFGEDRGVTLSTLFLQAKKRGWVEPITQPAVVQGSPAILASATMPDLPEELLNPTGAIKLIYDYMTVTARKIQPLYFLNAAISLVGTIMGQKYESDTGLRTNMYMISIGPTASGKDHARKCIKDILAASNLTKYLGGEEIRSGQGLLAAMERSSNSLFQLDEFGLFLQSAQNPNSGAHRAEVMTILMKLFSSANTVFMGSEYADQKNKPRVELKYPCCHLHATTTGAEFFPALSSTHVINGYLNRMLVLETKIRHPKEQKGKRIPPPTEILEWIDETTNIKAITGGGNLHGFNVEAAITISNSDGAERLQNELADKVRSLTADEDQYQIDALWGRAVEHTMKLATIIAGSNRHETVHESDMQYAKTFVEYAVETLAVSVKDRISDSPLQAKVKECFNAIRDAGEKGLTDRELSRNRAFAKLALRERTEVMSILTQEGKIGRFKMDSTGGRRREAWGVAEDD